MLKFDYHRISPDFVENYGIEWPAGASQLIKELKCFHWARWGIDAPTSSRMCSAYHHLMVATRLLWPERIRVAVERNGKRYDNIWFQEVMRGLAEESELMLTGPASAGKTCPVAVYNLVNFFSFPTGTTALVSTTSIKGADMRLWGEIRDLHGSATWKIGTVIESFKSITFNAGKELKGVKDLADRDMRNSVTVVAIPPGSEGQGAVRSIIGTKNKVVLWSIDELPEMQDGLLGDAVANLESNMLFQLVGIGNAKAGQNPHRHACTPSGGWDGHNPRTEAWGGRWRTATGGLCIFMDGEAGPNEHPELAEAEKNDLPFPFLSNPISNRRNAIRFGNGDPEAGRKTLSYYRMNIGTWPEGDVEATALTKAKVQRCQADEKVGLWMPNTKTVYCGADPAFSSGGDAFPLLFAVRGIDEFGREVVEFDPETVHIEVQAGNREEYAKGAAREVVRHCIARGVEPRCFSMDVSSDGGVVAQAIMKEWGSNEIRLISSLGKPSDMPVSDVDPRPANEVYDRRVSELWLNLSVGVELGIVKGYNVTSRYARDHFSRRYEIGSGGKYSIEKKDDFKIAHHRSCDDGDAAVYCWEGIRMDGIGLSQRSKGSQRLGEREPLPKKAVSSPWEVEFADSVYG